MRYLVVDEYQDVNPLQEALIREIAGLGANLCVVGDDDQTIYQWRGSDVQNIIKFTERYPNVKTERLNENFRSSKGIVLTARGIIEQNPDRLEKKMESTDAQPFMRGDILALQFANATEEAEWIAKKLEWLLGAEYQDRADKPKRGLAFSDMAILVRAWKDAGPIVEALRKAEVPYLGGRHELVTGYPRGRSHSRGVLLSRGAHSPRAGSRIRGITAQVSWRTAFLDSRAKTLIPEQNSFAESSNGYLLAVTISCFCSGSIWIYWRRWLFERIGSGRRGELGRSFFSISESSAN